MPRVDPARLGDLADIFDEVRAWEGIEERGGGTFYFRRKPFLHFHVGRDSRRADVRTADDWLQIDLPEPLTAAAKRRLVTALREEHAGRSS
jgi:hypothetical protein